MRRTARVQALSAGGGALVRALSALDKKLESGGQLGSLKPAEEPEALQSSDDELQARALDVGGAGSAAGCSARHVCACLTLPAPALLVRGAGKRTVAPPARAPRRSAACCAR